MSTQETREAVNRSEAEEHLAVIRRIMESATQLTVLPGRAAIVGGCLALVGCAGSWLILRSLDFAAAAKLTPAGKAQLIWLWVAIAVLGIAMDVLITLRHASKRGVSAWSRLAQLAAYAMGPAILTGLFLSFALVKAGRWEMLAPTWMMLYGAGVWMAEILSVRQPQALGAAFFLVGVITLFWAAPVALAMIALTFGIAHILYGIHLISRFGE